ncbi:NADH-quinone oxidoreductase subunit NuoF [Bdellovibrio sp. NC01]|uniref:NADH-quinone oxidoreductase subunit NuoF n=1 Tax=Bdellovibrio sp. NC01 TaxID=2220073 RepID=UPI00115C1E58|nr:NADH-quinone oxidoreductase subunit NuoF [Bdellovibrio sp. NC01]QDK38878.1 NADH-quinone oxidoreductase subunit F [Bdellovibrio sp. NC01]
MAEAKILTEFYHLPEYQTLAGYKSKGGYETLPKALKMQPQQIIDEVKASGLRGRGGAGFPTGMKWGFLPKNGEPRYLLCNADEGEPGTFKDRMMMERAPHQLIEGMIISGFAVGSNKGYIYVRGEYVYPIEVLNKAIKEAYAAGLLGKNILGSGFDFDLDVYRGAGAYICGEETGMISSLEGLKGQPKLKPPFPAVQGYLRKPTIVNNVETLAAVTYIVKDGAQAYRKFGTEKSAGTKLFSVSGNVMKPGNYEVPLGYPLIDLINKECGGMKPGRKLKAVIPGGSSAPILTAEEVGKANLDYESLAGLGSMLGSGAVIVMDDSQCMVDMLGVLTHFYAHESCGQCTPCREGTGWLDKILHSILEGRGRLQDIDLLIKVADNMKGKTICALSDAAALPVLSFVNKFRDEFEFYVREGRSKVKGTTYAEMHH